MELGNYLRVLRRNWLFITTLSLLGLLVGAVTTFFIQPTYTAQTQLFVATQSAGSVSELQQGNSFSQARVQSYVKTVQTASVLQPAIDALGLPDTVEQLAERIDASVDVNTVIIKISASDSSPVQAAALAQAVGDSLIATVESLESNSSGVSAVRLSTVAPAIAPTSPSSPNTGLNLGLGLILGLVLGLGISMLRTALDTKIRREEDVRRVTHAALLGGITYDSEAAKSPLLSSTAQQSPRAESFRQIRTNLQFAKINSSSKTMVVTSSLPGEGKSTTATNLAIAMSQAGQRVALVDADLRRPMVATYLGLEGSAGLTTALVGVAPVDDLLQPWGDQELQVLTSGQIPPNPSELLGSLAMAELIRHLESEFDVVIIDAPPLIPVTDAAVLSQRVGGVVLVIGSGKIKTQDLEKSIESLNLVGADVLGLVLNLLPTKGPDAYAHSYYSYEAQTEPLDANRHTVKADGANRRIKIRGQNSLDNDSGLEEVAR